MLGLVLPELGFVTFGRQYPTLFSICGLRIYYILLLFFVSEWKVACVADSWDAVREVLTVRHDCGICTLYRQCKVGNTGNFREWMT
jgi:hypothetical protein